MRQRFVYVLRNADNPPRYCTGLTSDVARRLSDRPTLVSTREVEIPGEHIAQVTVFATVAFVAPTTTAEVCDPTTRRGRGHRFEDRT